MEQAESQDLLSKLASKAKKKLNRTLDEDVPKTTRAIYEFKLTDENENEKSLQKKIVHLIANNPDCDDPIGRLIDHSIYDNLSEERRQAYILKLSQNYQKICEKIKS